MIDVDYQNWALAMCCLLDAIEIHADDEAMVRELVWQRFRLAEQHGLRVEMLGPPTSGRVQ